MKYFDLRYEVNAMEKVIQHNQTYKGRFFFLSYLGLIAMLLGLSGCVATRSWVGDRLAIVSGRVSNVETRLDETDAKFENLKLKSKLVLGVDQGVNFAVNSSSLNDRSTREIDRSLSDLLEDSYSDIVIAGHTDSTGSETYNYELGKRRAESVAKYLILQKSIDPTKIAIVSYGESSPIDDNFSSEGRSRNRRVEILVYEKTITTTQQDITLGKRKP